MRRFVLAVPVALAWVWGSIFGLGWVVSPATESQDSFPDQERRLVLDDQPHLRIGSVEGTEEYLFEDLIAARRLPDGRIVALDAGDRTIRLFDGTGAFLQRWGGAGEGPAEFRGPYQLLSIADNRIAVWDGVGRRVVVFDMDAGFHSDHQFTGIEGRSIAAAVLDDGVFVAYNDRPLAVRPRSQPIQPTLMPSRDFSVHLLGMSSDTIASLGPFSGRTEFLGSSDRGVMVLELPFRPKTHVAARRDVVVVGDSGSGQVEVYNASGLRVGGFTIDYAPMSISDLDLATHVSFIGFGPNTTHYWEQAIDLHGLPEYVPFFDDLRIDASGELLLVHEYAVSSDEPFTWRRYRRDGSLESTIQTDVVREDVLDFGEGWVLVRELDEFDVQYLAVYELVAGD